MDLIDLEDLYENAPCGYFSFLPKGNLIKANKTFLTWIGISKEELISMNFIDILHKGNAIYYEMIFLPMLKMQGFINEISFEIIRKDGTTFPGLLNAVAVKDENNNLKAVNVTLINFTDRKKYEKELLYAKEEAEKERLKFEILSNQIPDIIWTSKDTGEIDFLNRQYENATQLVFSDNKKVFLNDIIYEKDIEIFNEKWDKARKTNQEIELEVRLKKNDSRNPDWYLLRGVHFIKDEFAVNKDRSWLGTFTNINHQIKSLQQKDDFISIASHELKTPITIVKSYLEILQSIVKDATQMKFLEKCESGVDSLHQLVNNLLDINLINSKELSIQKSKEDLYTIIKDCISKKQLSEKKHDIILNGDLEPVYVYVDKMSIEQVIINLISNAIKYSPEADKVIVNLSKSNDPGKVVVSVEDFGIGIAKKDLDKIFERYYRVKSQKLNNIKGLGLGLFIIQQITKSHNSIIEVKSEVGKGSRFLFALDIIDE